MPTCRVMIRCTPGTRGERRVMSGTQTPHTDLAMFCPGEQTIIRLSEVKRDLCGSPETFGAKLIQTRGAAGDWCKVALKICLLRKTKHFMYPVI